MTESTHTQDARFLRRLGHALHVHGAPAHRLELALSEVAKALGSEATFLSTPTSLISSVKIDGEERMFLERLETGEVNLGNLAELDELAQRVIQGELDSDQGCAEIDRVLASPPRYPTWLTVVTCGLTSAAASILFGAADDEILAALVCGTCLGPLLLLPRFFPRASQLTMPLGGFVVSMIAGLLSSVLSISVPLVAVAGLIVVVPGLTLTIAVTELALGSLVSGTSRVSGAALSFILLGFGGILGSRLAGLLVEPGVAPTSAVHPLLIEIFAATVTAVCFTVLLQAMPRDLPFIVVAGLLTFLAARSVAGFSEAELAAFAGAFVAGVVGNLYSRFLHRPAMVTRVSSLLLLVPGAIGFRGVESMLARDTVSGVEAAFAVALIAVAIAVGLLLANAVCPPRQEL